MTIDPNINFDPCGSLSAAESSREPSTYSEQRRIACANSTFCPTIRAPTCLTKITEDSPFLDMQNNRQPSTILGLFHKVVALGPWLPAVECGSKSWTYAQLDRASSRFAETISSYGVRHGQTVPILTSLGVHAILGIIGILKAGATYVPLDSSQWSQSQIAHVLEAIGGDVLVYTAEASEAVRGENAMTSYEARLLVPDIDSNVEDGDLLPLSIADASFANSGEALEPDVACVIFTSGTTGRPKGVMILHDSLTNFVLSRSTMILRSSASGLTPRVLLILSIAFDACTGYMFSALCHGATVVLADPTTFQERFSTCEIAAMTPSMLEALEPPSQVSWHEEYPNLRTLILGGETPPLRLLRVWSPEDVPWIIYNDYGPTEATCAVLTFAINFRERTDANVGRIIGSPIPGAFIVLLDDGGEEITGVDKEGEIAIGGVCLAKGYWKDERNTKEKFRVWRGSRLYITGDYGRWRSLRDNKLMEFRGRKDRVVKNRGFLVNLDEDVDAAIIQTGTEMELGIEAAFSRVAAGKLCAVVVPSRGVGVEQVQVKVEALMAKMRSGLPAYHVPDILFVRRDLPKGTNGKIDAKQVGEIINQHLELENQDDGQTRDAAKTTCDVPLGGQQAGDDGQLAQEVAGAGDAVDDPWAEELIEKLADTLQCPKASLLDAKRPALGFAQLGGHSLAAAAIAGYCRRRGAGVTAHEVLTSPSVPELIQRCRPVKRSATEDSSEINAVVSSDGDCGPITDMQLAFIHAGEKVKGSSTIQARMVRRARDIPVLKEAWKAAITSEPIFRTKFDLLSVTQTVSRDTEVTFCWEEVEVSTAMLYEEEVTNTSIDIGIGTAFKVVTYGEDSTLIWTVHHALIDGYSASLILKKVQAVILGDRACPGPSFARLARELALLQEKEQAQVKAFCRHQQVTFDHAVGHLYLPKPDIERLPQGACGSAELRIDTGFSLADISKLAIDLGIRPAAAFYAAWAILLSNYTNSNQVVFGAVLSGRNLPLPLVDIVVGPLVNTLALRVNINQSDTAVNLLHSISADIYQLSRFQWLGESNNTRPFSTALATQYDLAIGQGAFASVRETSDIPMSVFIESDMSVRFLYHPTVYARSDISRMAVNYRNILYNLLLPDATVATCLQNMHCAEARRDLLSKSNALSPWTLVEQSRESLVDHFKACASLHADLCAVEKGSTRLTYKELDFASSRLAKRICDVVDVGDVVCLHADRSINWILAILGIIKARAVYCPLDEDHPTELRQAIFCRSKAKLYLGPSAKHLKRKPTAAKQTLFVDQLLSHDDGIFESARFSYNPRDVLYLCFTSGSTGQPKGVLIESGGVAEYLRSPLTRLDVGPGRRVSQFMSVGFDGAMVEIFASLCYGATLVLRPEQCDTFSVLKLVDSAWVTPSVAEGLDPSQYPNLRSLALVGEPLSQRVVDRWAPGRTIFNYYGPTEATMGATAKQCHAGKRVTIGAPVQSMRAYILNDNMDLSPIGVTGQIFLAGVQIARGYIGTEEEPDRKFRKDIVLPRTRERMYGTGDLGYWTEAGEIVCLGRNDRQVKLRGFRIDLQNIEETICEQPQVQAAAVTVEAGSVFAWVQPAHVHIGLLIEKLNRVLPIYARPKSMAAVDTFPLTKNGKLDYEALLKCMKRTRSHSALVAPLTDTEKVIAQEWKQLLHLDQKHNLSSKDNFLDLGGHSVLQLLVAARLSQSYGVQMPVRLIIESRSLGELALKVTQQVSIQRNLTQGPKDILGDVFLSPAEQGWWHKYQNVSATPHAAAFNVPLVCSLSPAVNHKSLAEAWTTVISRHKILRSRFVKTHCGEPRRIFSQIQPPVRMVDFIDVPGEINRPFNLSTDDLIRVSISPINITVIISHIICDLTALRVLLKEVTEAYLHPEYPLPLVERAYTEVCAWSQPPSPREIAFWVTYLKDIPAPRSCTGHKKLTGHAGTSRIISICSSLYKKILGLAKEHSATLHQIALLAVALTIQSLTNTTDTVLGSPFLNRPDISDQNVVGLFLEPLPMRLNFSDSNNEELGTAALIARVRDSSQAALAHAVPWIFFLTHPNFLAHNYESAYPIFDTAVSFHDYRYDELTFGIPGIGKPEVVYTEGAKFKLLFEFTAATEGLTVRLEYDTERVQEGCTNLVEGALKNTLEALCDGATLKQVMASARCSEALLYGV